MKHYLRLLKHPTSVMLLLMLLLTVYCIAALGEPAQNAAFITGSGYHHAEPILAISNRG